MSTNTPAPDGPPQPARALADVMRELADAASDGRVTVHADSLRAWADEIEEMHAALARFRGAWPESTHADWDDPSMDVYDNM